MLVKGLNSYTSWLDEPFNTEHFHVLTTGPSSTSLVTQIAVKYTYVPKGMTQRYLAMTSEKPLVKLRLNSGTNVAK